MPADTLTDRQSGFTLIEVLMALTIFALIAAIAYGAMGTAGQGFQMLTEVRDVQESSAWVGRQLRSDVAYLVNRQVVQGAASRSPTKPPIQIHNDNRGDTEFDSLTLLVHEPGRPGVSEVRYYIDEEQGHLIRDSRLLWARSTTESVRWDMGEAASWSVELLGEDSRWHQEWKSRGAFSWPRAIRIRMKIAASDAHPSQQREWYLRSLFGAKL